MDIHMIEKVTFTYNLKMDIFIQHWDKWLQSVKPFRPYVFRPKENLHFNI